MSENLNKARIFGRDIEIAEKGNCPYFNTPDGNWRICWYRIDFEHVGRSHDHSWVILACEIENLTEENDSKVYFPSTEGEFEFYAQSNTSLSDACSNLLGYIKACEDKLSSLRKLNK